MNIFMVFTMKELKEQIKTFKGVIIFIILLIFGMTSPLLAKLTPELMKLIDSSGIKISMPEPTFLDAYAQFFKNISQMVMIIIILVFSNGVVSEIYKGTANIILTKRLSRSTFILSKFTAYSFVWTISYSVSASLCAYYTYFLFPEGKPQNLLLSLFCMWFFGILIISISIFSSTIFRNFSLAAVGGFCIWGIISLVSSFSKIKNYSPVALETINIKLINGNKSLDSTYIPLLVGVLLTILFIFISCLILKKREF